MPLQIPFQTIDWTTVPVTEHTGETGIAYWRTLNYDDLRIRMVEYSAGYKADHWCTKGHIIFCVEGELTTELNDGQKYILKKGMSYHVSDDLSSHKSITSEGAKLFIIDGGFLK